MMLLSPLGMLFHLNKLETIWTSVWFVHKMIEIGPVFLVNKSFKVVNIFSPYKLLSLLKLRIGGGWVIYESCFVPRVCIFVIMSLLFLLKKDVAKPPEWSIEKNDNISFSISILVTGTVLSLGNKIQLFHLITDDIFIRLCEAT